MNETSKTSTEIYQYFNSVDASQKQLFDKYVELLYNDVTVNHLTYLECAKKYGYNTTEQSTSLLDSGTKTLTVNNIADFIFKKAWEYWYYSVLEGIMQKEINRLSGGNDTKKRFWVFLTVFLVIIFLIK
jgi:amino acid permease